VTRKRSDIDKAHVRKALPPRHEPHWGPPVGKGRTLGFRKISAQAGTWVARMRDETGRKLYRALGTALVPAGSVTPTLDYEQARAAAETWFRDKDRGVGGDAETVGEACRLYVADRRKQKGEATSKDYQRAFERSIYGGGGKSGKKHDANAIASVHLAKFRTRHLTTWRDGLVDVGMSKSTANRMRTRLVAALNYAVRERYVGADVAQEWRSFQPFKGASKRRDLYLDVEQRRKLLKACAGNLRDLVEATMLTGARAGELVSARVKAFDKRSGSITLTGKTGTRTVPLSPAAVELFERVAEGKLPMAWLLTRDGAQPWRHSDWDELVRDAAKAAQLPAGTCLYTLRHSWITHALTEGMSALQVAKLVGTSLAMIDRNYGHLSQAAARADLARVAML
jgi:integrase